VSRKVGVLSGVGVPRRVGRGVGVTRTVSVSVGVVVSVVVREGVAEIVAVTVTGISTGSGCATRVTGMRCSAVGDAAGDGVLVALAPHIVHLRDTDGDGASTGLQGS